MMKRAVVAGGLLILSSSAAAAGPELARFESRDLAQAVAQVPSGGRLILAGVEVAETGEVSDFLLERFEVFASDAQIVVHGEEGEEVLPAPRNLYFRGSVDGVPESRVFLAVLEDGTAQGLVFGPEETFLIGGDEALPKALAPEGGSLQMHRVSPSALKASRGAEFACGQSLLPGGGQAPPLLDLEELVPTGPVEKEQTAALPAYTARVAVETDYEYYTRFNSVTNATNYVGNLLGYASIVYSNQVNTSLLVQSVSLWTNSGDPWTQTSTLCGLMEFGRYWNLNRGSVSRTIAHFLSGRSLGGGIAWLGVLCRSPFATSANCPGVPTDAAWGGGYGFTASITGSFNISNPTVVWDIMAVSHEIGHNFNSPHTHCYGGLGGDANPVDRCSTGECGGNGCACGTAALPGPAGAGSGTIMSYCHLQSPGYSNVSLTFGTNHPYGVQPGRVPSRMSSHVVSVASANPSCLAYTPGTAMPFNDGFESGTRSAWQ